MKIGVVGLGSMGKRRVRDLRELGADVIGFDVRADRNRQAHEMFGIPVVDTFDSLLAGAVQAIVISTPPDCHVPYYELCFQHKLPFFSEANIFTPHASWFEAQQQAAGVRGHPSATWRFHPLVQELRRRVAGLGAGEVNSFSHQYGGFLPDWHPWEPYTDFYAGRARTCAAREMVPFELEILLETFGPVAQVQALCTQARAWDAPFNDTYLLLLRFERGITGTLSVELHHVTPIRVTRVSCREQALILDMNAQRLERYDRPGDSWQYQRPEAVRQNWGFQFEDVYREEIRHFLAALSGAPYAKTWAEDRHLSDVLYAAELSSREGRAVQIAQVAASYDGLSWVRE